MKLLDKAIIVILQARYGSTALLQRKLKISYREANNLLTQIEQLNLLARKDGAKPQKILN